STYLISSLTTPPTSHTHTLSLHDALPISPVQEDDDQHAQEQRAGPRGTDRDAQLRFVQPLPLPGPGVVELVKGRAEVAGELGDGDRKSTRLNSSHSQISYAVFCLKKKIN